MGMFDSVMAPCPNCGKPIEFQSKEGECYCLTYTVDTAPVEVLRDVLNSPEYCAKCGAWSALYDQRFPPNEGLPRPNPRMVRLREPSNPQIHSTQTFLRWWNEPFTEADILPDDDGENAA